MSTFSQDLLFKTEGLDKLAILDCRVRKEKADRSEPRKGAGICLHAQQVPLPFDGPGNPDLQARQLPTIPELEPDFQVSAHHTLWPCPSWFSLSRNGGHGM